MADQHIEINTTTRLGYEVRLAVDNLCTVKAKLAEFVNAMDQMTDAVDWSVVEARFGIPTGKGSAFYSLVNSASGELAADVAVNQLLSWCEGIVSA